MAKYRKKPVVIEAVQLNRGTQSISETLNFMGRLGNSLRTTMDNERFEDYCNIVYDRGLEINTLEGIMTASIGDYIIKGVKGEFYPCKPDIFVETYDEVLESEMPGLDVLSNDCKESLAGQYVNEYAKNHGITTTEAYEKPMCKAALAHYQENGKLGGW